MTHADIARFTVAMEAMNLVYRPELSVDQQRVYFRVLADLEIMDLEHGIERVFKTRTYSTPPTPAEIREQATGTLEQRAALAWARVYAYRGWGRYVPITFHDRVIHAAITAMGGWARIGHLALTGVEPVEIAASRKEFERYYGIYATTGVPVGTPAALCTDPALLISTIPVALDAHPPQPALGTGLKALPEPTWDEMPPEFKALVAGLAGQMRPVERVTVDRPAFTPLTAEEQADHERKRQALRAQHAHLMETGDG